MGQALLKGQKLKVLQAQRIQLPKWLYESWDIKKGQEVEIIPEPESREIRLKLIS